MRRPRAGTAQPRDGSDADPAHSQGSLPAGGAARALGDRRRPSSGSSSPAPTRDIGLGGIFAGVGFIVSLVVLATLAITTRPDEAERRDLDDQDRLGH
ncbi:MAG: hypothetical protein WDM88_09845 [Galbitalea sp.]